MKDLPEFRQEDYETALAYISEVLGDKAAAGETHLVELVVYDDGHFRAIFEAAYFTIQPGADAPSKSQWNSLKKKMKRHNPGVFVFKEHGVVTDEAGRCFVDFGFFVA